MTAGLGCGAVFLSLGKGRNDWLYNISHSPCLLPLDSMFTLFICLNGRSTCFTCVVAILSGVMITSNSKLKLLHYKKTLESFTNTTHRIRGRNLLNGIS